jgi:hypothetical protein
MIGKGMLCSLFVLSAAFVIGVATAFVAPAEAQSPSPMQATV